MFAYCGNNPVNREDSKGRWFSVVAGGVLGAVFGGISAYKNGENVLAGVLIGGAVGALTGVVGKFAGSVMGKFLGSFTAKVGGLLLTGTKVIAGGLLYAGGNALNQYVNYRQQNNAKRRSGQKGTVRSQGSSAYEFAVGQSQAVADRAYAAETFVEYFDAKSVTYAAISGALFTGAGLFGDKILATFGDAGKGIGEIFQHYARKGMVSFEVSFGQFVFDSRVAGG